MVHIYLDVTLVDVPAGVIQEEDPTGFLIHLLSAVLGLNFYREKDSAVPFPRRSRSRILCTHESIIRHLMVIIENK